MGAPLPTWGDVTLLGAAAPVYVRASAHNDFRCDRYQWLKAHPNVTVARGERRRAGAPFILGEIKDMVESGLVLPGIEELHTRTAWIRTRARALHERHRLYVIQAAEAVLDLFLDLAEQDGPLNYQGRHAEWTHPSGGTLYVWGMLFAGPGGLREIRRLRIGPAHNPDERDRLWDVQAAHVLANLSWPSPCTRVVVREVGAGDGSSIVHLDLTPEEAAAAFEAELRPALLSITGSHDAQPGNSCVECTLVRQCDALIPANGALAQTTHGPRRRSLSATDLARYDDCPAAWYYSRELNLPKSPEGSQALFRGSAVHQWLSAAHARGVPCAVADLPADSGAQHWLSPEAYEAAYPHLVHHVPLCPLAVGPVTVVASERTFHLFDPSSDVVVVIKPDMLLRRGRTLILREVKSSESVPITATRSEISSRFVQVHLGLAVIDALAAHHACDSGALELELLTPVGGQLWSWSSAHPMELGVARADIARRVAAWQADDLWEPKPNPLCVTCEVREWCSERDTFANNPRSGLPRSGPGPALPGGTTDMSWHPGEPF